MKDYTVKDLLRHRALKRLEKIQKMLPTTLKVVGKTTDGKQVVVGVAMLYFSSGIPLSIVFDALTRNNQIPSFPHLFEELVNNGISPERSIHILNEHVFESYGKEFRDVVIKRLTNI